MWTFIRKPLTLTLLILLLPVIIITIIGISQFLYTPPALTSNSITAYQHCVDFMRKHNQYKNLRFYKSGINWENGSFDIKDSNFVDEDRERLKNFFSINEIHEIEKICGQLYKAGCLIAARYDEVILFYPCRSLFLPKPGVLYSISSNNPNNCTDEYVSRYKPFINIFGPWYMSRSLRLSLRSNDPRDAAPLPKSLIDRSLKIKGIEFETGKLGGILGTFAK